MSDPYLEEIAALKALGLADDAEVTALRREALRDPDLNTLIFKFEESAACLAYDAPQVTPPPALASELMGRLPSRPASSKIITFPQWLPYALAACLVALAVYQANEIFTLNRQIGAEQAKTIALQQRNQVTELRLASLEAKDPSYGSAKVMVAWDPETHNGVISIQNLPAPPSGHDYQLWVLDSKAPPISAGLLKTNSHSQGFALGSAPASGPGFAISLEPAGGRPTPTGAILFAVAPGP